MTSRLQDHSRYLIPSEAVEFAESPAAEAELELLEHEEERTLSQTVPRSIVIWMFPICLRCILHPRNPGEIEGPSHIVLRQAIRILKVLRVLILRSHPPTKPREIEGPSHIVVLRQVIRILQVFRVLIQRSHPLLRCTCHPDPTRSPACIVCHFRKQTPQ